MPISFAAGYSLKSAATSRARPSFAEMFTPWPASKVTYAMRPSSGRLTCQGTMPLSKCVLTVTSDSAARQSFISSIKPR